MKPHAAQPRRVPRDRRDDRYDAGQPTPYKHASAGWVLSVQEDTVTVRVSGEELTGVIPLGAMPPVGAIVEVEARGDLLCIPAWFEGPVPGPCTTILRPTGTITSDQGPTSGPVIFTPTSDASILRDNDDATHALTFTQGSLNYGSAVFHVDQLDPGVAAADLIEVRYHCRYAFDIVSGTATARSFPSFLYANDADFATGDDALGFAFGSNVGAPALGPTDDVIYDYDAPVLPQPWMSPTDVAFYAPLIRGALVDDPLMFLGPYVATSVRRELRIYEFWIEVIHDC